MPMVATKKLSIIMKFVMVGMKNMMLMLAIRLKLLCSLKAKLLSPLKFAIILTDSINDLIEST